MADGRMLRRRIALDKRLAELSDHAARLIFTWCIAFLDVDGRMTGDPVVIKAMVFPLLKDITGEVIERALSELNETRLVVWYSVAGERYLYFPGFSKNQQVRRDREAASRIPPPPTAGSTPGGLPEQSRSAPAEIKGKEIKGKEEGKGGSPIDPDSSRMAEFLKAAILRSTPDARVPDSLVKWANTFRLMRDRDKRDFMQVRAVIEWATAHEFWRPTILSAEKVREKYDTLKGQMARGSHRSGRLPQATGENGFVC